MGLVRKQAQHDEVGIQTVDAVPRVGIKAGLGLLGADEIHDLVLTLSWDLMPGENHLHIPPLLILCHLLIDEILDVGGKPRHKVSS